MARVLTVLVVDDSALMRKTIRRILTEAGGFDVVTARTGAVALEEIARTDPDVVTLDVNMPEMDGLSCLAEIMGSRARPVVMVSSLTEQGALVTLEALALGAVDYVAKPGGTVSLNLDDVAAELVTKVRRAATARVRPVAGAPARVRPADGGPATAGPAGSRTASRPRLGESPQSSIQPARSRLSGRHLEPPEAVLIGASTGGPPLLGEIVSCLPPDFPVPVVIAQHMPASFTGALARRLDGLARVGVREVTGQMPLEPGVVYIGRGDADVVISASGRRLIARSVPAATTYRWHPSVDRLVASARAATSPTKLIGVLLTGMGDDGAEQMTVLAHDGGRTIAEAEETAVVWGMPGELVRRGGASAVLPADRIAAQLTQWVR